MSTRLPLGIFALAAVLALLLQPHLTRAQLTLPDSSSDLSITSDDPAPAPNTTVTLTAESALLDLANASITWSANGKQIASGTGANTATVQTGALGSKLTVTAVAQTPTGQTEAHITIVPASVDLLIEPSGYVPPFYRGRALAAPGALIRALAIPHLGTSMTTDQLIYTWRQDDAVVGSASGRGKSTALFPAPPLFGAEVIGVDVKSPDGAIVASATVRIPTIDPQTTLYQNHPLYGIEYYNALSDSASISDHEMTFAAVPYFAAITSPSDSSLVYAWTVNGTSVPTASSSASEITINADNSSGVAALGLTITSTANFSLDAQQAWTITLSSGSTAPQQPFSGSADAFHTTQ